MDQLKKCLLLLTCLLCVCIAKAQSGYDLNGTVTNDKNAAVNSATVFLSGTKRIIATDNKGSFSFKGLEPGSYELIVKMLGYGSVTLNVMLNKDTDLKIKLEPKPIELREVLVGGDPEWNKKYDRFKDNFLGLSDNAMECKILNPDLLNLRDDKKNGTLTATSDDFLIIENAKLGYRMKYLLKSFQYNYDKKLTSYDGKFIFEEMPGTDKMKQKWQKNREQVYRGSLMHFFRSVYTDKNEALKEGFITQGMLSQKNQLVSGNMLSLRVLTTVDTRPIGFDSLVNLADSSFISLRSKQGLAVTYDRKKAASISRVRNNKDRDTESFFLDRYVSSMQFNGNEVLIDSRGNINNRPALLIRGYWGGMRIGDQLPFEYQPPKVAAQ